MTGILTGVHANRYIHDMEILDYREMLRTVFNERRSEDAKYSLRAFARDLEIEPAQLSRVLKGTHNISLQSAQCIAPRIFKQKRRQEYFLDLVAVSLARKPAEAASALDRIKRRQQTSTPLELSWIDVISDWYHLALMDLITLDNAPTSPAGFAEYLGITTKQVGIALNRLQSLKLIQKVGERWEKTNAEHVSPSGIPSAAIRRYHKQMIQKASRSIDTQSVTERFLYGRTMTIKKSDLAKLETITLEYLDRIKELSEDIKSCDSVYQVNIQAFNLKSGRGTLEKNS